MFCPNCGAQNTETAPTCAKCGFQLKAAAAPKFKGTMLMMNQPGAAGTPPRPPSAPQFPNAPAAPAGAPASGPGFTAEAPPIGAGAPPAGAANVPSRLKGTMVGVAPPNFGAAAAPPAAPAAPAAPAEGAGGPPARQSFGSTADANPLAGTMMNDEPAAFAPGFGAPPAASGNPAFGAPPPPDPGGFNPPAFGAPPADAGGGFAPPAGGDPYGAPPPGGGFGPPPGGDIYGAPPGGPPAGASPYGAPPGGPPPQDYGAQLNQGFQQAGQGLGQAADQFGGAMNANQGAMQPYQGGNPMQHQGMGMPGAMTAGGPPKQFMITLLLALFAGGFGAHRFYTGHMLYGVLQLLTVGGCGIWALIDIIMIVTGKYTDAQGRPLAKD